MISLQRSMHSSQMYTPGPAMSFLTCFWLFPQNEHLSRSPPSPMRATQLSPLRGTARRAERCAKRDVGFDLTVSEVLGEHSRMDCGGEAQGSPGPPALLGRHYLDSALPADEDIVDEAVLLGLLGGKDLVALDVVRDLLHGLAAVPGQDRLELLTDPHDLSGLDLDVAGLPVGTLGGRLVDQDPGVRQRGPLALCTGRQEHGGGRGGLADAHRLHVGLDELHRVVNRRHGGERTAGRVDVDADVPVGVERLQREELGHHVVGRRVVDLHSEEDDALLEELVVRVHLLDAVRRPLHEGGEDVPAVDRLNAHCFFASVSGRQETEPSEGTWFALRVTWSTKPYSLASSAVNQRSRSESRSIWSIVWPVWKAIRSASVFLTNSICSAWIRMSVAVPPMPPDGWCIMIRPCGSAYRLPRAPPPTTNSPPPSAMPNPPTP